MQSILQSRSGVVFRPFKPACAQGHNIRHAKLAAKRHQRLRARASVEDELDLETQMEMFMKRQAEIESGAAFARTAALDEVIGGDVVSDEEAKRYCRELVKTIQDLKDTRDMSFAEIKLVVSIEDPRVKERRSLGIEDDSGISRDEMALALIEVHEGRIPKDRIALKVLHDEMLDWPFLSAEQPATAGGKAPNTLSLTRDYSAIGGSDQIAKPYMMGAEARGDEKPQSGWDMLPAWVGYGALYGVSAIPVLLAGGAIAILFANALK